MGNFGYLVQGLGGGLMNRSGDRLAKERLALEKDKWGYLKDRYEREAMAAVQAAAEKKAIQDRLNNQRNYYRGKMVGLNPNLANTDFPAGSYKSLWDDHIKKQALLDSNKHFGMMTGVKMPDGSYMSDKLIGSGVGYIKHMNPQTKPTDKVANAIVLNQIREKNPVLYNSIMREYKGLSNNPGEGSLTGIVKQFHDIHGRKPKSEEELKSFATNIRPNPQPTVEERKIARTKALVGDLTKMDKYERFDRGWKTHPDGSLWLDAYGTPMKKEHFTKGMGKRGNLKAAKHLAEVVEDAYEIRETLQDPEVQTVLSTFEGENPGILSQSVSKIKNSFNKFMQAKGISGNSKVAKMIVKMERMSSQERREMLGAAVTATELTAITPWLPSSGDSFQTISHKVSTMAEEGHQEFVNWLELFEDDYNVAPFYKAFNIDPFTKKRAVKAKSQGRNKRTSRGQNVAPDTKIKWGI